VIPLVTISGKIRTFMIKTTSDETMAIVSVNLENFERKRHINPTIKRPKIDKIKW